jgi:hypothetical protein
MVLMVHRTCHITDIYPNVLRARFHLLSVAKIVSLSLCRAIDDFLRKVLTKVLRPNWTHWREEFRNIYNHNHNGSPRTWDITTTGNLSLPQIFLSCDTSFNFLSGEGIFPTVYINTIFSDRGTPTFCLARRDHIRERGDITRKDLLLF